MESTTFVPLLSYSLPACFNHLKQLAFTFVKKGPAERVNTICTFVLRSHITLAYLLNVHIYSQVYSFVLRTQVSHA